MTLEGLKLAIGLFTRVPVRTDGDRAAREVMLWAPVIGLLIGLAFTGAAWLLGVLLPTPYTQVLIAVLIVGGLAYLTRGLHLDGLADTADGLGIHGNPAESRQVAKSGDIGAFGIVTIIIVTLSQLVLWTMVSWLGALAIALLAVLPTSRVAAMLACRQGSQAAPGSTLGAWVADTVPLKPALLIGGASLVPAVALTVWQFGLLAGVLLTLGMVAAIIGGLLFHRNTIKRFEGLTGDTLGSLIEITLTLALLAMLIVLT